MIVDCASEDWCVTKWSLTKSSKIATTWPCHAWRCSLRRRPGGGILLALLESWASLNAKPSSFICPLAQGPGNLTRPGTGTGTGTRNRRTGREWPCIRLAAAHGAPPCAPLLLLLHGTHLPFCRSLVTTLTLETQLRIVQSGKKTF